MVGPLTLDRLAWEVLMPPDETEAMYPCTTGAAQGAWRSRSGTCLAPRWVAPLDPLLSLCPAAMDRVRRLVATLTERVQQVGCGLGRGRRRSSAAVAATGCAAGPHAWWVEAGMIATATRLVVDGWRDLVTASGGALAAIVEAVLVQTSLGGDLAVHRSACPVVTAQGPDDRSPGV
jgi:hypothetical protein